MYYTNDLQLTVVDEDGAKKLYQQWNDYYGRACCDSADSFIVPETFKQLYEDISEGGLAFLVKKRDGEVIGYASLRIAYIPQVARPFVFIGKEYRGKGYGTQLMAALVYIAFQEVNARKISLVVYGLNQTGIHLYEKLGFKEEGRRLEEVYRNGSYWDVIAMGLFRKDWREYWQTLVDTTGFSQKATTVDCTATKDPKKPPCYGNYPCNAKYVASCNLTHDCMEQTKQRGEQTP